LYTFYVSGRNRHARLATVVQQYIGQTKAMAYLDFIDDVNELTIALREKGVQSAAYHGSRQMSCSVAMLTTYKEDILAALEHLAYLRGISTMYEDQSL